MHLTSSPPPSTPPPPPFDLAAAPADVFAFHALARTSVPDRDRLPGGAANERAAPACVRDVATPYVSVASWKYPAGVYAPGYAGKTYDYRCAPGLAENTRGVLAECVRTPLADALAATYTTDAHLFTYTLPGCDACPRINKGGLRWVLDQTGLVPATACFLADVDLPGHAAWTDALRADFDALRATAPVYALAGALLTSPECTGCLAMYAPTAETFPVVGGGVALHLFTSLAFFGLDARAMAVSGHLDFKPAGAVFALAGLRLR